MGGAAVPQTDPPPSLKTHPEGSQLREAWEKCSANRSRAWGSAIHPRAAVAHFRPKGELSSPRDVEPRWPLTSPSFFSALLLLSHICHSFPPGHSQWRGECLRGQVAWHKVTSRGNRQRCILDPTWRRHDYSIHANFTKWGHCAFFPLHGDLSLRSYWVLL